MRENEYFLGVFIVNINDIRLVSIDDLYIIIICFDIIVPRDLLNGCLR